MRLSRLILDTQHFEDYLSFFTEVMELELSLLTADSMELDLHGCVLEIRKGSSIATGQEYEFSFDKEEFGALIQKISFFYYRKGPTRFLLVESDNVNCKLIDPDGRRWRFSQSSLKQTHFSSAAHC